MNNIKKWYTTAFGSDELSQEINPTATFIGLIGNIRNTYDYIGVADSLVRERLFERIAELMECSYDEVYDLWVNWEEN
jgi:hypothetical protein